MGNGSDTKLISHFDGDIGDTGHDITINGSPVLRSFNAYGFAIVNYSGYSNGTDAYLTVPDSADWPSGTTAFTLDIFVNLNSLPDASTEIDLLGQWNEDTSNKGWLLHLPAIAGGGNLRFSKTSDGSTVEDVLTVSHGMAIHQWHHIRCVHSSGTIYLFVDGDLKNSASMSGSIYDASAPLYVGAKVESGGGVNAKLDGHITGVVVANAARATSGFDPPKSVNEITNDSNTKLLLGFTDFYHGETPSTVTDSSTGGSHTVTNVSSKVRGCTFWWGGSIDLDGTASEYLTAPDSADWPANSTDTFTIGIWLFPTADDGTGAGHIYNQSTDNTTDNTDTFELDVYDGNIGSGLDGKIFVHWRHNSVNEISVNTTNTVNFNQWNYVEIDGSGASSIKVFIDGVLSDNITNSISNLSLASLLRLGTNHNTSNNFTGYIGEIAISDIVRHSSGFTPPVSRASSDSNTKLLLRMEGDNALGGDVHNLNLNDGLIVSQESDTDFSQSFKFNGSSSSITIADSDNWDIT